MANPAKFDRCVRDVKRKGGRVNAYAVCTAAGTRSNPEPKATLKQEELMAPEFDGKGKVFGHRFKMPTGTVVGIVGRRKSDGVPFVRGWVTPKDFSDEVPVYAYIPMNRLSTVPGTSGNPKSPSEMTAGEINKALDKLDAESSKLNDEAIAAGLGHLRMSEIEKSDHPIGAKYREHWAKRSPLAMERDLRYGPGAPSRLPKGFGPRKRNPAVDLESYSTFTSRFARYERENGYASGESDALHFKPMKSREDMVNNMPSTITSAAALTKAAPALELDPEETVQNFIDVRYNAYKAGYQSVTRFTTTHSSKKEAEQAAANYGRMEYKVAGIKKEGSYRFTVDVAATKFGKRLASGLVTALPYGAKVKSNPVNPSIFDYEDAQRAAKRRKAELGGVSIAPAMKSREFEIWWEYEGKGIANPPDKAGNKKAYMAAWSGRRTNPESSADSFYESFHGQPPQETVEFEETEHYHGNLGGMGLLVELRLVTTTGYDIRLSFSTPDSLSSTNNPGLLDWLKEKTHKTTVYHVPKQSAKMVSAGSYKGYQIYKDLEGAMRVPQLERESAFDTVGQAKKFIDQWTRTNGKRKGNPLNNSQFMALSDADDLLFPTLAVSYGLDVEGPSGNSSFLTKDVTGDVRLWSSKRKHGRIAQKSVWSDLNVEVMRRKGNPSSTSSNPALLTSNESGTQMYIQGGDQSLDLNAIHMGEQDGVPHKDSMVIGEAYFVSYFTQKEFDEFEPIIYEHDIAEESDPPSPKYRKDEEHTAKNRKLVGQGTGFYPTVRYDTLNQKLYLDGGVYKIELPMMGVSAGIEN